MKADFGASPSLVSLDPALPAARLIGPAPQQCALITARQLPAAAGVEPGGVCQWELMRCAVSLFM